ncbi:MAG TPA: glycosyltransferase [Bacteroidetes bacterium]|nr:glycosyltransferase [Bacteroidota bacterium]
MCGIGDEWIQAHGEDMPEGSSSSVVEADSALIIFIKNPELGKAKTRLAATIGDEKALEAYVYMLAHTRNVAVESRGDNYLYYSSFVDNGDAWDSDHFQKNVQISGDLGEKMKHAFSEVFAAGKKKVLIIGSDCLDLKASHINKALKALDQFDFVLGPANDGGYYLLGMREFQPGVFDNMKWSTEFVLADTLRNIAQLELTVYQLETLNDVDSEADLLRAMANHPQSSS